LQEKESIFMRLMFFFNLLLKVACISAAITLPIMGYCYKVEGSIINLIPQETSMDFEDPEDLHGSVKKMPSFLNRNERGEFLIENDHSIYFKKHSLTPEWTEWCAFRFREVEDFRILRVEKKPELSDINKRPGTIAMYKENGNWIASWVKNNQIYRQSLPGSDGLADEDTETFIAMMPKLNEESTNPHLIEIIRNSFGITSGVTTAKRFEIFSDGANCRVKSLGEYDKATQTYKNVQLCLSFSDNCKDVVDVKDIKSWRDFSLISLASVSIDNNY